MRAINLIINLTMDGVHVICDMLNCNTQVLNDRSLIVKALKKAAKALGSQLLAIKSHQFQPHGVTAIALIATSHIAIHTWPEYQYAALDIMTCSPKMHPEKALEIFKLLLEPQETITKKIKRRSYYE